MNVDVLRDSFTKIAEVQPLLTKRFYEILFDRHPDLRPLFPSRGMEAQEKMLTQALAMVLARLEDGPWLSETLEALGARHVAYGVKDEMYPMVGGALLIALGEAAGEAWTPELEREWTEAFGFIAACMQAGARRVTSRAA